MLDGQQYPVPFDKIQASAGKEPERRGPVMPDNRGRDIQTPPTRQPSSHTQFRIVAIGEEILIEPANLI